MKQDTTRIILTSAVVALATTLLSFLGLFWIIKNQPEASQFLTDERSNLPEGGNTETLIIRTAEKANPAVVAITISKNVPVYERYFQALPAPFEDIFGERFFAVPRIRQKGTEELEIGGGSGFLVSADGYIVTNRHVVDEKDALYTVFTNDGQKYPATVVSRDSETDIAVLKIDGQNFPHLPFGNSDDLRVGQTVVAIGNALAEFRNTVSAGIVSGLSRSIVASDRWGSSEALEELIQTDAAINQGNSGGPLLNLDGEVVGVNVAVADGAENIGFALSSNSVKNIIEKVRISRP